MRILKERIVWAAMICVAAVLVYGSFEFGMLPYFLYPAAQAGFVVFAGVTLLMSAADWKYVGQMMTVNIVLTGIMMTIIVLSEFI